MIGAISHRGLKRLFEQDDPSGVNPEHVGKLRNILATLHAARTVAHMDLPGFRLHPLRGAFKKLLDRYSTRQLAGDFPL
jgi:proteic killer suppression protein